jgi:hypothetical protein
MDQQIIELQKILCEWDPLGDKKNRIPDLNNYETEAMDITSAMYLFTYNKNSTITLVMQTMNEAFDLTLSRNEAVDAGNKIWKVYLKYKS